MAFAPVISLLVAPIAGAPGVSRIASGIITMGSADTYVTGGFTLTPAQLGLNELISNLIFGEINAQYIASGALSGVNQIVKLNASLQGTSQVLSAATTATVTLAAGTIGINTPIFGSLDDSATGGGGSGTWAVTTAIASIKRASATTFTITTTAGGPASGGNFTWQVPSVFAEAASADAGIASVIIPFIALGV